MVALLLKASLIVVVFLSFYKVFLEKESFFAVNRIYLLGSLILAFILPFIPLPKLVQGQGLVSDAIALIDPIESIGLGTDVASYEDKVDLQHPDSDKNAEFKEEGLSTAKRVKDPMYWLKMIYSFGVLVLFLKLLSQITGILWRVIKSKDKVKDGDTVIINTKLVKEPYSFFKYVFIDPEGYDYETYEQIIDHEKIHIRKMHQIDLLLAEIATIVLWFNPFIWAFRKEVEKNLEYQTDAFLLEGKMVRKDIYQMNLLKIATHNRPLNVTTNYNQSMIKQRILKMNSKKSRSHGYWKYAFLAPLLFGLLLVLNQPILGQSEGRTTLSSGQDQEYEMEKVNTDQMDKAYKSIYVLIDETTQEDRFSDMEELLAQYGVSFTVTGSEYRNGRLTAIDFKADLPDVHTGPYSTTSFPVILFKERDSGYGGLYNDIPARISPMGKSIVENNLNGVVVFHHDGSFRMNGSGSFQSH
ncbi:M56 family metallopeptidase [Ulvibacterium sp.]|uniref:M56 family metallopeptidase n=1 Tax=Ulvibacterium sp. TaxID=2665914 RepID=UPI003BAB25CA